MKKLKIRLITTNLVAHKKGLGEEVKYEVFKGFVYCYGDNGMVFVNLTSEYILKGKYSAIAGSVTVLLFIFGTWFLLMQDITYPRSNVRQTAR
ncbi:hypothetical protein [Lentibacillus daqui]|uniref:hypothetical protein n=1 Tax=Lentibacillus daqui TaxID=2911514 RepID=UPI0022B1495A|nr:hypothetical protein [Lentibacillus daqui]